MAEATKADLVFVKTTSDLGGDIQVPIAFDSVRIQTIVDAAREYEASVANLDTAVGVVGESGIIIATGKDDVIAGEETTGITMKLINDWRVEFAARPGPTVVSVSVFAGNLVAKNSFADNPIKPSAFTQPTIRQSQAPAAITVGGIVPTADQMRAAIWDSTEVTPVVGSYGARLRKLLTRVFFLGNT